MRVLPIMLVCAAAVAGFACVAQGGENPERPGILSTELGTTADVRGALATLDLDSLELQADTLSADLASIDGTERSPGSSPQAPGAIAAPASETTTDLSVASGAPSVSTSPDPGVPGVAPGLEPLVPGLRGRTFSLQPGPRPFLRRLSFSPGIGRLGDEPLYVFRVAYNPSEWLGWEAHIGHNRGKSVHALFHMLNAQVRYPVPFRVQPYLTGGFGIVLVFPGTSINADPVTKNALAAGGGLELYLRDDLALRGEWRRTSVFARDRYTDESTVYAYDEVTFGLSFYRRIGDGS
jgi:hypothetical protein